MSIARRLDGSFNWVVNRGKVEYSSGSVVLLTGNKNGSRNIVARLTFPSFWMSIHAQCTPFQAKRPFLSTAMGQRLSAPDDRLIDADNSGVLLLPREDGNLQYSIFHRLFHTGAEWGVVKPNLTSSPSVPSPLPYCWDEFHDMCEAAHKAHMQYADLSSGRRSRSARFVPLVRSCYKSKAQAFEMLYLSRFEKAAFFQESVRSF